MTGERFELVSSARGGDGRFRFRWTLDPGRRGPPEHRHRNESETFTLRSGALTVWIDDVAHALERGAPLVSPAGSFHRFHNPGTEPAVVDVELDGVDLEETMVPMAVHFAGREPSGVEALRIVLHDLEVGATVRRSPVVRAALWTLASLARLVGARRYAAAPAWTGAPSEDTSAGTSARA
jgi:quercetin dioxygenase-like cupin family protein